MITHIKILKRTITNKLRALKRRLDQVIEYTNLFYKYVLYNQTLSRRCLALALHLGTYVVPYSLIKAILFVVSDYERNKRKIRVPFLGVSLLPDGLLINYWVDYCIIHEIYRFRPYERFYEPQQGSIVFDVGAHVGCFSLKTVRKVGEKGLIIAIEPHPISYKLLMLNLRLNRITNVIPIRVAISDRDGIGLLYLANVPREHSTVLHKSARTIPILLMSLKSLVERLSSKGIRVQKVDLVKIDVEGSELDVVRGICDLKNTFKRLVIAAYHTNDEANKLASYLMSQGYKVWIYTAPRAPFVYAMSE